MANILKPSKYTFRNKGRTSDVSRSVNKTKQTVKNDKIAQNAVRTNLSKTKVSNRSADLKLQKQRLNKQQFDNSLGGNKQNLIQAKPTEVRKRPTYISTNNGDKVGASW